MLFWPEYYGLKILYNLENHHTTTVPLSVWILKTRIMTKKRTSTHIQNKMQLTDEIEFFFFNWSYLPFFICCNVMVILALQFGCVCFFVVQYVIALFKRESSCWWVLLFQSLQNVLSTFTFYNCQASDFSMFDFFKIEIFSC